MSQEYTQFEPMPEHRFIERHLVTLAIQELLRDGWLVQQFEDEEHEFTKVTNAEQAWEAFDSVDMGWLHFENTRYDTAWVLLIGGNGRDVISDHTTNIEAPMARVFLY